VGEAATTLENEIKDDNRKVSRWLLYYHERRREYLRKREDIMNSSPSLDGSAGVSSMSAGYVSNPTASKGDKLADLHKTEKWVSFVEEIERRLSPKMQVLLRLRRQYVHGVRGRPVRWIIALKLSEEISRSAGKDYSVGPDTVDKWWRNIVTYAVVVAAKKRLL